MPYLIEDLLDEDDYYDDFVYDGIDGLPFQDDDEWVNDGIDGLPFQDDNKLVNDRIDGLPFQDDDIVKEEKSSNKVFSKVREFFRRN